MRFRHGASVIGLGAVLLVGCGGPAATPRAAPSALPSAAAGASADPDVAPTTAASVPFTPQLPAQICCAELVLDAGRYALPGWLGPPLEIEPPAGWGLINEARARYLAFGEGDNSVGTMSRLVTVLGTPSGTTSDDVIAQLSSIESIEFDGPATASALAGFETEVLEGTARPNPDFVGDPAADIPAGVVDLDALEPFVSPGFRLTTSTPGARVRFVVLDIGPRVLIAACEAPPSEADTFFSRVDALLGSLALVPAP